MFTETDKKVLQVVLVFAVFAILGLFYYVWAFANPQLERLQKMEKKQAAAIKTRTAQLTELKRWEGKREDIRKIVDQLKERLRRLPQLVETFRFVNIIRQCMGKTNLSDMNIGRMKKVPMGAYEEMPYLINCRARYHDLGQFLTLIEQHPEQIIRVKRLTISNDANRPSRHPVRVTVATFVFTEKVPPGL
jgi:Tfp pilus assembly protein PilO